MTVGSLRIELEGRLRSLGPLSGDILGDPGVAKTDWLTRAGAVVTGVRLSSGAPALQRLAAIREQLPHVGLYVVVRSGRELEHWLPELASLGVDDVFCLESESDWRLVGKEINRRVHCPPPEVALRALWADWERNPRRALAMHLVRNGHRPLIGGRLTQWFGVHEKTLGPWLSDEGATTYLTHPRLGAHDL